MYIDTNGNEWDTAQEALQDFINDLPPLTDEEKESVLQFTLFTESAEFNLRAIAHGVTYSMLDHKFAGDNYPVPYYQKEA